MLVEEKGSDNRVDQRLDLSLQISLRNEEGRTVNVSTSGVFLEITTDNLDSFPPGTTVPVQLEAATTTPGIGGRKVKLYGEGRVVRRCIIEVTGAASKLGLALEFQKKLNVLHDTI